MSNQGLDGGRPQNRHIRRMKFVSNNSCRPSSAAPVRGLDAVYGLVTPGRRLRLARGYILLPLRGTRREDLLHMGDEPGDCGELKNNKNGVAESVKGFGFHPEITSSRGGYRAGDSYPPIAPIGTGSGSDRRVQPDSHLHAPHPHRRGHAASARRSLLLTVLRVAPPHRSRTEYHSTSPSMICFP